MIALAVVPRYSHTMPLAPFGSGVLPKPATPTGFGSVVPSADPTVLPEGQAADAAVVAGIVTVAVAVAVGVDADAVGVAVDPVLALPHAPRAAAHAKVVRGIQRELLRVTCNASVNYVPALGFRLVHV